MYGRKTEVPIQESELDGHSTVGDVPPLDDILLNIAMVFCYVSRMASCI